MEVGLGESVLAFVGQEFREDAGRRGGGVADVGGVPEGAQQGQAGCGAGGGIFLRQGFYGEPKGQ